jgi:hypothetical protein
MACTFCGSTRHTRDYCPQTWPGSAARMRGDRPWCTFCHSSTHNRDACPQTWPGPNPQLRED